MALIKSAFFILIIFLLAFTYFTYIQQKVPYHADEYEWIGRSYFFDLLIHRKFNDPLWNSYYSYDHPKLVYYLYGAYLYPAYSNSTENSYIHFLSLYAVNQTGTESTPKWDLINNQYKQIYKNSHSNCAFDFCKSIILVKKVRLLNIVLLSLSCVLIYLLSELFFNKIYAFFATLIWITNPIVWKFGIMAIGEGTFLLFFNLSIYLLFLIYGKSKQNIFYFIFFAISAALCFSTKLHGLLLIFIFYSFVFFDTILNLFQKKTIKLFMKFKRVAITTTLFLTVTYILNPFLWLNPFYNTVKLFTHRLLTSQGQAQSYPASSLHTVRERLLTIYFYLFGSLQRLPFRYHTICWTILVVLFLIGIYFIARQITNKMLLFFSTFVIILLIFMSIMLTLSWERYYNILVFPFILILVLGIKCIVNNIPFTNFLSKKIISA